VGRRKRCKCYSSFTIKAQGDRESREEGEETARTSGTHPYFDRGGGKKKDYCMWFFAGPVEEGGPGNGNQRPTILIRALGQGVKGNCRPWVRFS